MPLADSCMILGLDFDNTIVSYETVFHKVALERGYIGADVPCSKLAVRDDMRARDMEDRWTEIQGYVYGKCMDQADVFPGVIETLCWVRDNGHDVMIVSHKTHFPFAGPKYDLHKAARDWIEDVLQDDLGPLINSRNVNFIETMDGKINRIGELGCDLFIDDLPEIFLVESFPEATQRFLFDPGVIHDSIDGVVAISSWKQFLWHLKA